MTPRPPTRFARLHTQHSYQEHYGGDKARWERKASRGGTNASARNHTPEALELPPLTTSFPKDVFLLHTVIYSEHHHFQQPIQQLQQKELTDPFWYDCFKLSRVEDMLHIMTEWERSKGMPRRPAFLRQGFSLHEPEWGRVGLAWLGYDRDGTG